MGSGIAITSFRPATTCVSAESSETALPADFDSSRDRCCRCNACLFQQAQEPQCILHRQPAGSEAGNPLVLTCDVPLALSDVAPRHADVVVEKHCPQREIPRVVPLWF